MKNAPMDYETITGDYSLEEQIEQVKEHNNPEIVPKILENEPVDMILGGEGEFGKVFTNPIPVNGIHGERVYLSFLHCKICEEPLLFHRCGSKWFNVDNKSAICSDNYEVSCYKGCMREHLFLAPYYPKRSVYVPKGYIARVLDYKETPVYRFLIDWPNALGTNKYVKKFPYGLEEAITFYFTEQIGNPSMTRMRLEKYKSVTDFLYKREHSKTILTEAEIAQLKDLFQKNELQIASGMLENKYKQYPEDTGVLYYSGRLFHLQEKYDDALSAYVKVFNVLGYDRDTLLGIGLAYQAKKEYEPALIFIKKALLVDPNFMEGLHALAAVYQENWEPVDKNLPS